MAGAVDSRAPLPPAYCPYCGSTEILIRPVGIYGTYEVICVCEWERARGPQHAPCKRVSVVVDAAPRLG